MFWGTRATSFSIYTTKMEGAGPKILGTGATFKRVPCQKNCRINQTYIWDNFIDRFVSFRSSISFWEYSRLALIEDTELNTLSILEFREFATESKSVRSIDSWTFSNSLTVPKDTKIAAIALALSFDNTTLPTGTWPLFRWHYKLNIKYLTLMKIENEG